jgi:hypothetical protein
MIQSNDPRDLYMAHWNLSQQRQQERLAGGSWSQPPWMGWKPIIGAGHLGLQHNNTFFQRYGQDGDMGFFYSRKFGRGEPLGMNPNELNHLETEENYVAYEEPKESVIAPVVVEPSPAPIPANLELDVIYNAEPRQKAYHVPPYSQQVYQGMGNAAKNEDNVLYEEPFEYKGRFDKKKSALKKK